MMPGSRRSSKEGLNLPPLSEDDESFREVFLERYPAVWRFFLTHGLSEEESRDLTQETFLRVYKGFSSFRGEAQLSTWIFQIARNIYLNQLRGLSTSKREGAEVPFDEALAEPATSSPNATDQDALSNLLHVERSKQLREALESLPSQMRRCVLLRVEQDLKYREISVLLGISIDTVKALLFQARSRLKEQLGESW